MTDPSPWPAPTGSPVGLPRGPGRAGYLVGALVIVIGSIVAIAWFLIAALASADPDYPGVPVPGDRQVELEAKPYTVFDERADAAPAPGRTPTVRITGPNGDEPISPVEWPDTYVTVAGRTGTGFGTIHPTVSGVYRVQVLSDAASSAGADGERVTIGQPDPMTGALLAMLLGALTFVGGLAVIAVTAVRRWRWRSRTLGPGGGITTPPAS